MRLICPNCDAQYEVDANLIPENGRDVQCSSCGDTWFQTRDPEGSDADDDLSADIFAEKADEDSEGEGEAPSSSFEPAEEIDGEPNELEPTETVTPEPQVQPERAQGIDDALMQVLREEASRETQARIDEGTADIATQTDMGLEELGPAPADAPDDQSSEEEIESAVSERTARLRGIEPEDISDGSPSSRRDLLPDIEEINSTLRATSDRKTSEMEEIEDDAPARQSGFRIGFSLIIVFVAILLLVYSFAPLIGAKVPALDPALQTYVRSADHTRDLVDSLMESVIQKMNESGAKTE